MSIDFVYYSLTVFIIVMTILSVFFSFQIIKILQETRKIVNKISSVTTGMTSLHQSLKFGGLKLIQKFLKIFIKEDKNNGRK